MSLGLQLQFFLVVLYYLLVGIVGTCFDQTKPRLPACIIDMAGLKTLPSSWASVLERHLRALASTSPMYRDPWLISCFPI